MANALSNQTLIYMMQKYPDFAQFLEWYISKYGQDNWNTVVTTQPTATVEAMYKSWLTTSTAQQVIFNNPTVAPTLDLVLVQNITVKNSSADEVDQIKSKYSASVDGNFTQGKKGVMTVPVTSKNALQMRDEIEAKIKNAGGSLWAPSEVYNGKLYVYFITGMAPLVIAGIVILAILVAGWLVGQYLLSVYQLKLQDQQATQDAQTKTQEEIIETITNSDTMTDAEKADALADVLDGQYQQELDEKEADNSDSLVSALKTPLLIFSVGIVLAILLPSVLPKR